ncbi:hypothetical protein [Methanogenium cariaci]|uniref:hypothetical protein n=1 Tax=Methanogenium cariaci TaxID=2197 RepID=UPI001FDF86BA|nr:hypothetical protein [Methanogenium cariaci]
MIRYILTFICAFCTYLVLTAGSGDIGLWSVFEIVAGGVSLRLSFLRHRRNGSARVTTIAWRIHSGGCS